MLTADQPCYPALPREQYIGENPIGGLPCSGRFTGCLLLIQPAAGR